MSKKLKHMILPAIAVGLMVVGTNGLKEAAYSATFADTPTYYQPKTPIKTGVSLNNEVRLDYQQIDLGPSFTFLVHGIGGNAGHWSNGLYYSPEDPDSDGLGIAGNDYNSQQPWNYLWNDGSLINKVINAHHKDAAVYLAKYESNNNFKFYRFDESYVNGQYTYQEVPSKRNYLSETYKHNIVVYQSDAPYQSLADEFAHFEHVVNTLCFDYQKTYGFNPKINLVGHSRGGLVVQSYVNKYPYNVSKYFNLATPYNGTESLTLLDTLVDDFSDYMDGGSEFVLNDPAYNDLRDTNLLEGLKNTWNDLQQNTNLMLEGYDFGGVMTLPYLTKLITDACGEYSIPLDDAIISLFVGLLNDLNNMCISNTSNPISTTGLIKYDDYLSACQGKLSQTTKNQMKELIYQTIYQTAYQLLAVPMIDSYIGEYEDIPVVGPVLHWLGGALGHYVESQILNPIRNDIIPLIVDSISSFNGQIGIFNNDVLVDIDSQMADGYWGQNRFVKIFGLDYLQPGIAKPSTRAVLVGHNLETLDNDILEKIIYHATFPNYDEMRFDIATNEVEEFNSPYNTNVIGSTVKKYIIDGSKFGSGTQSFNPCIKISNRGITNPLTIVIKNFKTSLNANSANVSEPFIRYTGSSLFDLTIEYQGTNSFAYNDGYTRSSTVSVIECSQANIRFQPVGDSASLTLTAAKGTNGRNGDDYYNSPRYDIDSNRNGYSGYNGGNGTAGSRGSNCVVCKDLNLQYAKNITLKGGNGGNGGYGGNGGRGANGKTKGMGYKGGDGGNGGNGGNGGYSFACTSVTMNGTDYLANNINLYPGKPGMGGYGGRGGDGGDGANGSSFIFSGNHNGGNGGNGGKVGYGGNAGYSYFDGSTTFDLRTSNPTKYNAMKARCGSYLSAFGGYCGNKFGNGGNAGRRSGLSSQTAPIVSGDGTPGKAVTGAYSLNGFYGSTTSLYSTINGSSYIILNGVGRNSSGEAVYYTNQPAYGRNGSVVYNYDDNY